MNRRGLIILALALLVVSNSAFAPHAAANYDKVNQITLMGTVTHYLYNNPHVQIRFDVEDKDGNVQNWTAWSTSPLRLYKVGWKRDALKPGDKITVSGGPDKDGSRNLSIRKLVSADGRVLTAGAE